MTKILIYTKNPKNELSDLHTKIETADEVTVIQVEGKTIYKNELWEDKIKKDTSQFK